jgi:hypothetical protein
MAWSGEILKAVFFPVEDGKDAATIWNDLTGQEPDEVVKKSLPRFSTAVGAWREFALIVAQQPTRVEAAIRCIDPNPGEPIPIPNIAPDSLDAAIALAQELGQGLHRDRPAKRFAAQVQLVVPVQSLSEAVALLNTQLDDIFPLGTEDALFQINVRRPMQAVQCPLNRLMKWGTAALAETNVLVSPSGAVVAQQPEQERRLFAFMHLDVNNKPLDAPTTAAEATEIVDEIWTEIRKLASGGRHAL